MGELFIDEVGSGTPILFLHGNGLDQTALRPWHDSLAKRARLLYPDLRWNGRSVRAGGHDHATWHRDAAAILDGAGEQRAIIYGHSYGAWLALGFALRFPERVAGLILCGVSPAFDYVPEVIAEAQRRDPVAAAALVAGLSKPITSDDELRATWHAILPLYFHGASRPAVLEQVRFSAPGFQYGMEALAGFNVEQEVARLGIPMLILVGAYDYITPPTQARRLAVRAQRAEVVELTNSGHFPYVEETDAYLAAIHAWLDRQ